jgi:hypothetical protein
MYSLIFTIFLTFLSYESLASGAKRPSVPLTTNFTPTVTPISAPIINEQYSHLDPEGLVPNALLKKTVEYFEQNKSKIKNKKYIAVLDFKQHNSKERFYIIDIQSGYVEKFLAAHGKNSDSDYDGYATDFSNTLNSEMSSVGFYLTAETYQGSHGLSLALDGLSTTNSNARSRSIVIHGASYVTPGTKIGRSWGCPALDLRYYVEVINQIKGGVLIYAE